MKPGDLVSHFRIVQRIGGGAMGEVFIAQDETLKRRVAIKTIHTTRKQRPDVQTRFAREARVLSQLDHPHICRIYEYISTDEDDLIVLELIEGRTLTALGDDLKYAQKLEVAEQIASALVAAHAEGIVHRDLKPGNIMLTRSSGVKVLDFGLACVANTEEEITPDHSLPPGEPQIVDWSVSDDSISGFHTEVGRVFGTVQYMAPEQAEGETVGPAADMFSFGLVLQEIFTGTPARRLVKQDGLARAAEGFSTPVEGLPSDLTELITRLKERAPTRRPTALEALRILQRIRSKPERRLRAGLIGAAIFLGIGGITKYTLDLTHQQAETESNRQQVEANNSFLLGGLYDVLDAAQLTAGFEGTVRVILDYYSGIPTDSLLPDQIVNFAQARILDGKVRGERSLSECLEATTAALSLLDSQPASRVAEADKARLRRYALFQIGEVHEARGERDLAERAFRSVADLAADVNVEWKDKLSALAWNGRVQTKLGDLSRAHQKLIEAHDHYESAQRCFAAIPKPNPEERYLSAEVEFALGNVATDRVDYQSAEGPLTRYVEIAELLAGEAPSNKRWQKVVAFAHTSLGTLYHNRNQSEAARAEFTRSVEVWRALTIHDPGNSAWKNSLAEALSWLSTSELRLGHVTKALAALEEGYGLREVVTAGDPTNMALLRARAICENNMGDVLEALDRSAEATPWFTKAVARSRHLIESDPSNKELLLDQAVYLRRLGRNLCDQGDYVAAQEWLDESLDILKQEPSSPRPRKSWMHALAHCRLAHAELHCARGLLGVAGAELERVAQLLNSPSLVDEQDPTTNDVRAFLRVNRARLLEKQGNAVESRSEALTALHILDDVFWKSYTGRRARALLAATRIAHGEDARDALFDRFQDKGYFHPAIGLPPWGN